MLFGYKILVLCTSSIHEDRFCNLISAMNETLVENNWRCMVFCTESDLYKDNKNNDGSRRIFELINYDVADCIVISDRNVQDKLIRQKIISNAKSRNIPVIIVGNKYPDTYSLTYSGDRGFEDMINHVIDYHNARDLHFMAGSKDSPDSNHRLSVFKQVLIEHDIPFDDSMVSYGDFWDGPTRIATQKLLDSSHLPEAIICANDTMALSVISVLAHNGYDCPDDVIVTGFDGIKQVYFSSPKVSTVICDHRSIGKEAAQFAIDIVNQKLDLCDREVSASLLIQESCGCKSSSKADSLDYLTYVSNSYNRYRNEDMSLSNMSSQLMGCHNLSELSEVLKNPLLYNVFVLLKSEILDESINPIETHTSSAYGNSMYVMLDSDSIGVKSDFYIKTSDLIPRMEEILNSYQMPLIFTSLHNIERPIGYLCFCFCAYEKQNYTKVGQIATWLGSAFSGYRSLQYQKHLQKKIEKMYQQDSLTGLLNRTGFTRKYDKVMRDDSITDISIAMCDLDNLKYINDNFSHREGDNAINIVAKALSTSVPPNMKAYFCRYGGDEIVGLYIGNVDEDFIKLKVHEYLQEYNESSFKGYEVSTSIGIYSSKKQPFEKMFGKADKLMYEDKMTKTNRRK